MGAIPVGAEVTRLPQPPSFPSLSSVQDRFCFCAFCAFLRPFQLRAIFSVQRFSVSEVFPALAFSPFPPLTPVQNQFNPRRSRRKEACLKYPAKSVSQSWWGRRAVPSSRRNSADHPEPPSHRRLAVGGTSKPRTPCGLPIRDTVGAEVTRLPQPPSFPSLSSVQDRFCFCAFCAFLRPFQLRAIFSVQRFSVSEVFPALAFSPFPPLTPVQNQFNPRRSRRKEACLKYPAKSVSQSWWGRRTAPSSRRNSADHPEPPSHRRLAVGGTSKPRTPCGLPIRDTVGAEVTRLPQPPSFPSLSSVQDRFCFCAFCAFLRPIQDICLANRMTPSRIYSALASLAPWRFKFVPGLSPCPSVVKILPAPSMIICG